MFHNTLPVIEMRVPPWAPQRIRARALLLGYPNKDPASATLFIHALLGEGWHGRQGLQRFGTPKTTDVEGSERVPEGLGFRV